VTVVQTYTLAAADLNPQKERSAFRTSSSSSTPQIDRTWVGCQGKTTPSVINLARSIERHHSFGIHRAARNSRDLHRRKLSNSNTCSRTSVCLCLRPLAAQLQFVS